MVVLDDVVVGRSEYAGRGMPEVGGVVSVVSDIPFQIHHPHSNHPLVVMIVPIINNAQTKSKTRFVS